MRIIIVNYFTWWYLYVVKNAFTTLVLNPFIFSLYKTKTLPMLKNFSVPFFRSTEWGGKYFSVFIRSCWIILGTTFSFFKIIPGLFFALVITFIPILIWLQIVNFLIVNINGAIK